MELREALAQITEIRQLMARAQVFRGFRSVPVAFSGLAALVVAGIQAMFLPSPTERLGAYLFLWIGTAAASTGAAGCTMILRAWYAKDSLSRETTWIVLEQFLPSLIAACLLTLVIVTSAPETAWMLPGLWALFYATGLFSTARLLPKPIFWVAVYYLAAGLGCLLWARDTLALCPASMAIPFGGGQLLIAAVLYWCLERQHDGIEC